MKKAVLNMFGWFSLLLVSSQSLVAQQAISDLLTKTGMENVIVNKQEGILRIAYDNPVYRDNAQGLFDVIRLLLENQAADERIHIILLQEQIPQLLVQIPDNAVKQYRSGQYSLEDVMRVLTTGHDTKADMAILRGQESQNHSFGKVDVVLYPQVLLRNAWMDKLYGVVLNVAPAVEVGLWKGASFTGQVILPLWNNMKGEMDYIRAGMLLFRQQAFLFSRLYTTLSIGNFNSNRIGADLQMKYRPDGGQWAIGAQGGLTGSSTFYSGKWEVTQWSRLSGNAFVQYYLPRYNIDFDLSAHRYIYGDYGVRMDCSRHFGEVTVGVYAMHSGGEYNGGFHFSIPLYPKKIAKRKAIQVRLPKYFDWQYEAQTGNEYAEKRLGRDYETRPDENRSQFYYNPDYIKSRLIQLSHF